MSEVAERPRLTAVAVGVVAALVVSVPFQGVVGAGFALGIAALLGSRIPWLGRGAERPQAPWFVVAGIATLALAFGTLLGGGIGAALWFLATGVIALFAGTQLALSFDPPAGDREFPAPLSVRSNAAVAADAALLWGWQVTGAGGGTGDLPAYAADLRAAARRNREQGVLGDPRVAHPTPPVLEKVTIERVALRGLGEPEHLRFESDAIPRDPEIREPYLAFTANRTAHAWLWRAPDGPRPTIVLVHGYGMGRPAIDARAFEVPRLQALGVDVALAVLPLHGARAMARRSGSGFIDAHPLFTNAAFEQAVSDLRRLVGWLRQQGAPSVGAMGMSLGGYTTALLASVERGLACAIPQIPAVRLTRVQRQSLPDRTRDALEAAGISTELLSEAWAGHEPLRHEPIVAPEGRLIVAGLLDRICPPEQAHALWEHWKRPSIHWTPGSHLAPLGAAARRDRIEAHLQATLLAEAPALPLSRFRS